jgi:hypothetical protein
MGGFIRKVFGIPKQQPQFIEPVVEDVKKELPPVDDKQREEEVTDELEKVEKKRKGRRSTILNTNQGLLDIDEENIDTKNLLGGN